MSEAEKRSLANIEYSVIVPLIAKMVNGKWFSKIQKIGEATYRLKIGSENLIIWLGKALFLSSKREFMVSEDQFCNRINKALRNSKLVSFFQLGHDRIIVLEFRDKKLIIEQFGKGNIILCDSGDRILDCMREEQWSSRKIKKNEQYVSPPTLAFPSTSEDFQEFLISREKDYLVVALSRLPIGITYVKKVLAKLGLAEQSKPSEVSPEHIKTLYYELAGLFSKPKPLAVIVGDQIVEFYLVDVGEGEANLDALLLLEQYYSPCLDSLGKQDNKKQGIEIQKKALEAKIADNLLIAREIEQNLAELEQIAARVKNGEKKGESLHYFFEMDYSKGLLKIKRREKQ